MNRVIFFSVVCMMGLAAPGIVTAQPAGPVRPVERLTLRDALERSRSGNPGLQAAAERIVSARARIPGNLAWMPPMVGVNAMNIPTSTLNPIEADMGIRLMVSQTIPWPGKRRPGVEAAEQSARSSEAGLEAQRRIQSVQVVSAYSRLALLAHTRSQYEQQAELVRHIADLATKRYRNGAGSQQDVLRAGLEATQFKSRTVSLASDYAALAGELRVLLGAAGSDSLVAATSLDEMIRQLEVPSLPADSTPALVLASNAVPAPLTDPDDGWSSRPEALQIAARRRAIQARLEALRQGRKPDVTINAEYAWVRGAPDRFTLPEMPDDGMDEDVAATEPGMNTDGMAGQNTWSVGLTFTLPSAPWSRRGLTAEEESWRAEERALDLEELALRQQIQAEQATAAAQVRTARETLRLYEQETRPQAEIAYRSAVQAYETGAGDLTSLLETWRALVDVDYTRAVIQAGYVQALAARVQASGTDLLDLVL